MYLEHDSRNLFYRCPFGAVKAGDTVTIRLSIRNGGIPFSVTLYGKWDDETEPFQSIPMGYVMELCNSSIYEAKFSLPQKTGLYFYYFHILTPTHNKWYGNNAEELGGLGEAYDNVPNHTFQITVYDAGFETPLWFRESVVYQIFPDRFYNGLTNNSLLNSRADIIKRNWGDMPFYKAEQFGGKYLANDFFGGNLEGIIKKLPYLSSLGITTIYLNPIFRAYSNHKYDTGDYFEIDPMFGDIHTFRRLCEKANKYGIRLILDGVFNHTGSDSRYFNKNNTYNSLGAYQSTDSPYYTWYQFINHPDDYHSWWGIDTLPHVDENDKSFQDFILNNDNSVIRYWLKQGAWGWRLDVADELPDSFLEILRKQVKSQNKDAVIIGEVWEDASHKFSYGVLRKYLQGHELDSVMNYPFRSALLDFATGTILAEQFHNRLMSLKENYPSTVWYALLNFLSTHDVERVISVLGDAPIGNALTRDEQSQFRLSRHTYAHAKARLFLVITLQVLLPGVPCIYYGDEVGMEGLADPFSRQTFPWGKEDMSIFSWYQSLIELRKRHAMFVHGSMETVYKIGSVYGFIRQLKQSSGVVLVNMKDIPQSVRVDLARFSIPSLYEIQSSTTFYATDGIFYIDMDANSVKILIDSSSV